MGETAAETAREVAALRAETERLLDILETRAREMTDVRRQVAANPLVVAAVGVAALLTVLALWYRSYRRAKEARRPIARLRRGAAALREEARVGARRVRRAVAGEEDVDATAGHRRQEREAEQQGLVQKLLGTIGAAATLALVDQFTRWLSKRQSSAMQQTPQG